MQLFQQSEATAAQRRLFFHAVDATDGLTAETGLTGAGRISKNGAATAATSANISEIDSTNMPGRYYIEFTAAELDTLGIIEFRFKAAACAEVAARGQVVPFDPYDATRLGLTALPNAAAAANGGLATVDASNAVKVQSGTGANQVSLSSGLVTLAGVTHTGAVIPTVSSVTAIASGGIGSGAIASAELNNIADAVLKRDWTAVTGEAARSALNALRFLRNKWTNSGGTLTVRKEDDTASAWTATVTTTAGNPVSEIDPA